MKHDKNISVIIIKHWKTLTIDLFISSVDTKFVTLIHNVIITIIIKITFSLRITIFEFTITYWLMAITSI